MPGSAHLPDIRLCPGHATLLFDAPAGWTWRARIGPHHNLWLALDGRGELRFSGVRHAVAAGTVCLLLPGQEVEVRHDRRRPVRNFSAHFTLAGRASLPALVVHGAPLPDLQSLAMQALHAAAGGEGDALGWAQAGHLVAALLCRILRHARDDRGGGPHAARVRLLAEEIRLHPERGWSLATVAAELGLSRAQAARSFRAAIGDSPTRFAIRCRMERAARLLAETDLPVGAIAGMVGYADLFYFSRHFTAQMGSAPSRFRSGN